MKQGTIKFVIEFDNISTLKEVIGCIGDVNTVLTKHKSIILDAKLEGLG